MPLENLLKINFVYRSSPHNNIPYYLYEGLKNALERNGFLYYSYDLRSEEMINLKKLFEYPVLFIKGYAQYYDLITSTIYGNQKMILWETETVFNNDGSKNILYQKMADNAYKFDLVLGDNCDKNNYFGRPTIKSYGFVPLALYDAIEQEPIYKAGFVGNAKSEKRKKFIADTPFIIHTNNAEMSTQLEHLKEYVKLCKSFKILVSPSANTARSSFCVRNLEYMACKRLCLAEHLPYMDKLFEDKKEIVYWETPEQLKELVDYYLSHQDEAKEIAENGYQAIKTNFTDDIIVKQIVEKIYDTCCTPA
jgi:glycosyltransferase involved in cell wall biosynthesis